MIKTIEKTNISSAVYDKMMEMIVQGLWQQGEMIPSENELCEAFGVSRNTIRQGIQRLSALGIINSVQGKGTFVSEINPGAYLNLLIPTMFLGEKDSISILQFMKAVQVESVRLVCTSASDEKIRKLGDYVSYMGSADNYTDFFNHDSAYHHYLAEVTGNSLFIKSMELATELLKVYLQDIVILHGSEKSLEQHDSCYKAILQRDVSNACKIMESHYDMLIERLGKLLSEKRQHHIEQ